MSEVSLHHSISAACKYSENDQISMVTFYDLHLTIYINNLASPFVCQDSCVHMEQVKLVEKWSSEFSYAAGSGIRPHPPSPGWATPRSPGQASVRGHSNCQAVYGGTGPRQHSNRGPNEPPTSIETTDRRTQRSRNSQDLTSRARRRWERHGRRRRKRCRVSEWIEGVEQWLFIFPPLSFPCFSLVRLECFS